METENTDKMPIDNLAVEDKETRNIPVPEETVNIANAQYFGSFCSQRSLESHIQDFNRHFLDCRVCSETCIECDIIKKEYRINHVMRFREILTMYFLSHYPPPSVVYPFLGQRFESFFESWMTDFYLRLKADMVYRYFDHELEINHVLKHVTDAEADRLGMRSLETEKVALDFANREGDNHLIVRRRREVSAPLGERWRYAQLYHNVMLMSPDHRHIFQWQLLVLYFKHFYDGVMNLVQRDCMIKSISTASELVTAFVFDFFYNDIIRNFDETDYVELSMGKMCNVANCYKDSIFAARINVSPQDGRKEYVFQKLDMCYNHLVDSVNAYVEYQQHEMKKVIEFGGESECFVCSKSKCACLNEMIPRLCCTCLKNVVTNVVYDYNDRNELVMKNYFWPRQTTTSVNYC